jgi:lipopolysaccharide transport system ATP-binding protein
VSLSTWLDLQGLEPLVGRGTILCEPGVLPLNQGRYYIKVVLSTPSGDIDSFEQACKFEVVPDDVFGTGHIPSLHQGLIYWSARWKFEDVEYPA